MIPVTDNELKPQMNERDTIEYLFSKLESNISNGTFSAIFCKDDDKPVISKNDVKKAIKDTLKVK